MKNKVLAIILGIIMICGLTGCNKNKFDIGEQSDIEIVNNEVTLALKDNTLTKTGVTLILKNESDKVIQYGNPYEIQIKKDGLWHEINVELNFTLPAYLLNANDSIEIKLNWENSYGKLASGEYRIIKSINVEKEDGIYDSFNIAAEFSIK